MKIISNDQILFFKNSAIIRFESVGDNTIIYFLNGKLLEIDESIDSIEVQLKDSGFIRIHDKHIVNVNYITNIPYNSTDLIKLENGVLIPVSKKIKDQIIEILKSHIY